MASQLRGLHICKYKCKAVFDQPEGCVEALVQENAQGMDGFSVGCGTLRSIAIVLPVRGRWSEKTSENYALQ